MMGANHRRANRRRRMKAPPIPAQDVNEFSEAAANGIDVSEWGVGATPQTVARLTEDPILSLSRRDIIGTAEESAAFEIRAVYRQITAPVSQKGARLDGMPGGGWHDSAGRHIDGENRYNAWADAMDLRKWALGPVLDVIAEGESMHRVERRFRMRNGSLTAAIKEALKLYAETAGWA